jgi:hypothetical protein
MRYQQVYALLILGQGKRKTYKKLRKDKQAQKRLTKDNMFRLAF